MSKFKVGDVIVTNSNKIVYKVLDVDLDKNTYELFRGTDKNIDHWSIEYVDKSAKFLKENDDLSKAEDDGYKKPISFVWIESDPKVYEIQTFSKINPIHNPDHPTTNEEQEEVWRKTKQFINGGG